MIYVKSWRENCWFFCTKLFFELILIVFDWKNNKGYNVKCAKNSISLWKRRIFYRIFDGFFVFARLKSFLKMFAFHRDAVYKWWFQSKRRRRSHVSFAMQNSCLIQRANATPSFTCHHIAVKEVKLKKPVQKEAWRAV